MRTVIALGVAVIAVVAIAHVGSTQDALKLAIVAEITGGGAPSGTMWRDGVLLAVEDINKAGGGMGRPPEKPGLGTPARPPPAGGGGRGGHQPRPPPLLGGLVSSRPPGHKGSARPAR